MARRKSIKSVCSAILGSFVSRNNDVEGYWGMGVLYRYAKEHGRSEIKIDLLDGATISKDSKDSPKMIGRRYGGMLQSHLMQAGIDAAKVVSAHVNIHFETRGALPPPPQVTWGLPYVCSVTVTDDLGKTWSLSKAGVCGPHDSRRESRRLQAKWGAT